MLNWRWYTNRHGNNPNEDYWDVDVTSDGETWVSLEHTMDSAEEWLFFEFDLSDYITLTDQVQIRFVASDEGSGSLVEAGVDDFLLDAFMPPATDVPDETARRKVWKYVNPRKAEWPKADYIVSNPPFVGNFLMREALGDGYTDTIRSVYSEMPESCDYVMYWWHLAACYLRGGSQADDEIHSLKRFGFISTNSIKQSFNRRVLQLHVGDSDGISLVFGIPDHPWVDSADGADVRIAMTVASTGTGSMGDLNTASREDTPTGGLSLVSFNKQRGVINSDLTIGTDTTVVSSLQANAKLSSRGVMLFGAGFIVSPEQATKLGYGRIPGLEKYIRHYRHGRDLTKTPRGVMVIDLHGLTSEEVQEAYPEVYQWVFERVKPARDQNREPSRKKNWWLFGRSNEILRDAIQGLPRYIATPETAKHRFFVFLDESILPDNGLVNIGLADAYYLGVLSSHCHVTWSLKIGGRLGVGNDPRYNKSRCFDTFPFPVCSEGIKDNIRALAENIDAHRNRRQEEFTSLSLTEMYNVLEKQRCDEPLSNKDKSINEHGLCSVLLQLHKDLDKAVFDAYGWPSNLTDEEILTQA